MQKRWLVKRRQLVVLEAATITRIYGQQQLGKCWCIAGANQRAKIFVVKLYSCKIFLYVFCVRKYFCNEQKANYGTFTAHTQKGGGGGGGYFWRQSAVKLHNLFCRS